MSIEQEDFKYIFYILIIFLSPKPELLYISNYQNDAVL